MIIIGILTKSLYFREMLECLVLFKAGSLENTLSADDCPL